MRKKEKLLIFCDDTACPVMPKETPEQAAWWAQEKPKMVQRARELLREYETIQKEAAAV